MRIRFLQIRQANPESPGDATQSVSSLDNVGALRLRRRFRCIPIHTCPSNVVCATLVRDGNPPLTPPAVRVTLAASSLTTGGEGLSRVEATIRSSFFAGSITDVQTIDLADDPALTLGQRLTIANKTRGTSSTSLRSGGVRSVLGHGILLRDGCRLLLMLRSPRSAAVIRNSGVNHLVVSLAISSLRRRLRSLHEAGTRGPACRSAMAAAGTSTSRDSPVFETRVQMQGKRQWPTPAPTNDGRG